MSENSDNVVNENASVPPMSHRRILWTLAAVALIGALLSGIFISRQFGLGVLLGGGLSFINYYWLKISLKRVFDAAVAQGDKPRFLAVRYFSRYLTLGAILAIVFLTEAIPIIAVVLGLASFGLAIVVEGLIRIFSTFFKSREL